MKATVFRFPTTALPVQVQRDYLSYADVGAAPLTRPLKLLELLTLSKADSPGFDDAVGWFVPGTSKNSAKVFPRFSVKQVMGKKTNIGVRS